MLINLIYLLLKLLFNLFILIIVSLIAIKIYLIYIKNKSKKQFQKYDFTIAFFHPFSNSGGGGERVLWSAIQVIQEKYKNCMIIIYTGDVDLAPDQVAKNVEKRFTIIIDSLRLKFIPLKTRPLVLDKYYPVFTLLGQSLGSMIVGLEGALRFLPDIYIETTGYAFTYPIYHYLARIPVCCYVHYPTISVDMLKNVSQRNFSFNNRYLISQSRVLTQAKLFYYKMFSKLYSVCGRCACCIMVNSSWTLAHINTQWSVNYRTSIVYPPCDVESFFKIENPQRDQNFFIASVAQFRPEKNHQLQVKSFSCFIKRLGESKLSNVKLLLIGSCRNAEDEKRVQELRKLCDELKITNYVDFKLNVSFDELKQNLANSAVGLHSMKEEHFGIGVVECMAAGTITLAHNSGGPKEDIIIPYRGERTGYLAETEEQYSDSLLAIYNLNSKQREKIRNSAREHVKKFSQFDFNSNFMYAFENSCLLKFNLIKIKQ